MRVLVSALFAGATAIGPIEKVIQLLEEMKEEAITAMNEGDAAHAKNVARLSHAIDEADQDAVESGAAMKAAIAASEAAQAAIDKHASNISDAVAEINTQKDNLSALKKQRSEAKAAYQKNLEDAQMGIVACERLIDALDDISDKSTAASFIQERLNSMPNLGAAKALIQAVAQFKQPQVIYKADDKFKEIVNMIQTLKGELEDDLTKINTEEANEVASHNMAVQNAKNTIKNNENEKAENEDGKANQEGKKAGEDEKTEVEDAANKAARNLETELKAEKKQAESEYDQAKKARTSEIEAIGKATKILAADQAVGGASGGGNAFLQVNRAASEDKKAEALEYLRKRASSLHSQALLMITEVASEDPFAKVKGLISDLVTKLEAEAAAAQTKHEKCVKDMTENKESIAKSNKEIEKLNNEMAKQKAIIGENETTIAETTEAVAKIEADRAAGQEYFNTRTAELTEIIATGLATHKALVSAIDVLKGGNDAAGAGGPGFSGTDGLDTIISFLENIQENQNQANVDAQTEKDDLKKSWDAELEGLEKLQKAEQNKQNQAKKAKAAAEEDLTTASEALDTENTTMDGLQDSKQAIEKVCIAKGASHEENKQKREDEIQSLKEALTILQSS